MKILMTSDTFLPLLGGAEIHVKNLMERLSEKGHEVSLVTCQEGKSDLDSRFTVSRIAWSKHNAFRLFRSIWGLSSGADIIHCHYSYRLAVLAGLVGRIKRIPVFVTLHGLGTLDEPKSFWIYRLAHSTYRYLSLNLATHIISTSQDLANVAYKYVAPSKIGVILNGYDERVFSRNVSISDDLKREYAGKKIILTVRRLVPKNGIHFLIESMPFIIKEIPSAHYVAIGDGRMRQYIEERIQALGIKEHVTLVGRLDNSLVPGYIKLADTVIFPSTAESSSIACSEAMAVGKPIVASAVGGLVELLGKNDEYGILVKLVEWTGSNYDAPMTLPQERYRALAKAIVSAIKEADPIKEERLALHALATVSWDVIVGKTIKNYERFTKKR